MHWVRALMVLMHLGRIDRPFVPCNLISAQESSRWPPDLILMSSGSKKGTQIYYPFLSKNPGKRIHLHFPQRGPYGDRCPLTEHFYISLDISLYLKGPKKRAAPMEQTPIPEPYLTYLSGSQVKEPSLQVPLMESPWRELPCS